MKRKKEEDFDSEAGDLMVYDVKVGRVPPEMDPEATAAEGIWEARPGGIWLKRGSRLIDGGVTAADLLFGADAAEVRPLWTIMGTLSVGQEARLTVRKGQPVDLVKPELRMNDDRMFKIMQIAGRDYLLHV